MRFREFCSIQATEIGALWKHQMMVGVLLILSGLAIIMFPEILVALVAATILLSGVGLMASACHMRRLQNRTRGFSILETCEW